ncbi:MAG: esterase family protein [Blastocatellia bacterium]
MRRDLTAWYSHRLHREMPLAAYGHYGTPILMLPTAAADYLEYERFHLIDALRWWLDEGRIKLYTVNSVNQLALMNRQASPAERVEWLHRYEGYITEEVLPFIRQDCRSWQIQPLVLGISLGATSAANLFFRRPDLYAGVMLISGSYDIRAYLDGHVSEQVYFHNPVDFLPRLEGTPREHLRHGGKRILIFTGQGSYEAPDRSRRLSTILSGQGIPHWLDVWGHDVAHDWQWWRQSLPYHFGHYFG